MEALLMGLAMVASLIILFAKLDIRKFLAYDAPLDIVVTGFLGLLGASTGTFSGLVAGVVSGLVFSFVMVFLKAILGSKKLTRKGWKEVRPRWRATAEDVERMRRKMRGA